MGRRRSGRAVAAGPQRQRADLGRDGDGQAEAELAAEPRRLGYAVEPARSDLRLGDIELHREREVADPRRRGRHHQQRVVRRQLELCQAVVEDGAEPHRHRGQREPQPQRIAGVVRVAQIRRGGRRLRGALAQHAERELEDAQHEERVQRALRRLERAIRRPVAEPGGDLGVGAVARGVGVHDVVVRHRRGDRRRHWLASQRVAKVKPARSGRGAEGGR